MKASELISYLERLIKSYGDLDIIFEDEYTDYRSDVLDILIEYGAYGNNFKLTNYDLEMRFNK